MSNTDEVALNSLSEMEQLLHWLVQRQTLLVWHSWNRL